MFFFFNSHKDLNVLFQPRHCVIAHTEGIVTVTPCSREAETFVNGQRIFETTILQVRGPFCKGQYVGICLLDFKKVRWQF